MNVLIVNCAAANAGRCKLLNIELLGSTCARCKERLPIKARPEPIWFEDDGKRFVYICESKESQYSPAMWEKIAACRRVGKQYEVPVELMK